MKRKRLYMAAVATAVAGVFAVAAAAPASAARGPFTVDPHQVRCGAQPVTAGSLFCGQANFTNNTTTSLFVVPADEFAEGDIAAFSATFFFCTAVTLPPGGSCPVFFSFDPSDVGRFSAKFFLLAPALGPEGLTGVRVSGRGTN
jgi:hypothetical protein